MSEILQIPTPKPKIRVRKFGHQGWEVLIPRYFWMPEGRHVYASGERALFLAGEIATIRTQTFGCNERAKTVAVEAKAEEGIG